MCVDPDDGTTTTPPLTGTIDLDDGETVTCTFTNTQRSTIVIVKDAVPDGPQDFSFTGDLGDFTLDDDPADDTLSNTFTSALLPANDTYVVTETVVDGWDLTGLVCTSGAASPR